MTELDAEMFQQITNMTIQCIGWTTVIVSLLALLAFGNIVAERAHHETLHQKRMKDLDYEHAAENLRRYMASPEPKPLQEV